MTGREKMIKYIANVSIDELANKSIVCPHHFGLPEVNCTSMDESDKSCEECWRLAIDGVCDD